MLIKRVAGAVTLLEGLWLLYIVLSASPGEGTFCRTCSGPALGAPLFPILLGVLLLVDSALCLLERWIAFLLGALLSATTIVLVLLHLSELGGSYLEVSAVLTVLSLAALILDVKAAISQPKLSEENHPLNLPVFG